MLRTKLVQSLIGVALIASMGACGSDDDGDDAAAAPPTTSGAQVDKSKPPVRIALVSFNVPGADYVGAFEEGAKAALKHVNEDLGGFGGRRGELETCDTKYDPAGSTRCANTTVANKPVAMFGCDLSWAANGLPVYEKAGILSFNCPNVPDDYTSPWNVALESGAFGEWLAHSQFICGKPEVKSVAVFAYESPGHRELLPESYGKPLEACGKRVTYQYYEQGAADLTPAVNKLVQSNPDFVAASTDVQQTVQFAKALRQAQFPTDRLVLLGSSLDEANVLEPAGDTLDGAYGTWEFVLPTDESNPDVRTYLAGASAAGIDNPNDVAIQWGFAHVMFYYNVAKEIGFDKFNATTLRKFMESAKDFPVFMSRALVNPGPPGYPSLRQPYVQMVQVKDGGLVPLKEPTGENWLNGFSSGD